MNSKVKKKPIPVRIYLMNAVINGLVCGVVCGLGFFLLTIWLVLKGGEVVGPHLALLGNYFIGYSVTWIGSFIGLAYGFASGFIVGFAASCLYNIIVKRTGRFH